MRVSTAVVRLPAARADAHERVARARARSRSVLHERAAPDLDVEHERVDPLGELLRQDAGATISGIDSTVAVTSRSA